MPAIPTSLAGVALSIKLAWASRIFRRYWCRGSIAHKLTRGSAVVVQGFLLDLDFDPVLIVLDVNMPEMDGLEAFKRLQEEGIDVPVVVCTGYDEYDLARTHAGLGFAGFLAKPFSMNALGNAIERALAP